MMDPINLLCFLNLPRQFTEQMRLEGNCRVNRNEIVDLASENAPSGSSKCNSSITWQTSTLCFMVYREG